MCLFPRYIKNRKFAPNKKNGGYPPPVPDERVLWVPRPCGECLECRRKKAREWQVRLLEDIREHKNGIFVTLTFSDESIAKLAKRTPNVKGYTLDNAIATHAVHLFRERWRKETGKSPRHWLITELGGNGTENVHLHGIIYTHEPHLICKHWQYGFVWDGYTQYGNKVNYVSESTITYITKYVSKRDEKHKEYKPVVLTSPGIGAGYKKRAAYLANSFNGAETKQEYQSRTGHKMGLPTYYRNALYTDEQKEQLWLHILDKNERWVMGERIDTSTPEGEQEYFKVLEHHRSVNNKLGFGNGEKDWDRKEYENELRNLKIKQRIAKGKRKNK